MADPLQCTGEISSISAVILGILNGVSGLAAIIGNLMVLITFFKNQSLRQPCYYLMSSLAAMDLLVGLAVNPLYIALTNFVPWQYREEHLLQLESFFAMTSSMVIMHTLTVMSIERYIAVNYALRYRTLVTEKRSCIAIAIVWTFGFSLNSLFFVTSNDDLPKMWLACGVLTGLAPTIIIIFCYGKILQAARAQSRRIAVTERCVSNYISRGIDCEESTDAAVGNERSVAKEVKRARKAAWGVAIAVAVVMSLSMPVSVVSIMQIVTSDDVCRFRYNNRAWMWGATLSLISSVLDPWIYTMRIREFKDCFKRTMHVNWIQNSV